MRESLTEAAFLLKREGRDNVVLFALLERGIIRIGLACEVSFLGEGYCSRLVVGASPLPWGFGPAQA